ncbi:MAG: hypothetical protein J7524_19380 [Roseofilum sp. Belize BBD 4]|uniref:hypothetical protein n=2 Tax=unclassified Roseofilum TaxID=2620099 RepID=UPI001B1BE8C4|nr:hypothetical protein [Roseofilum sp. Belize BBD 4]MBP0035306.1 hypothetical protein [Roseofilum sp. Belize BBD 4]
MTENATQNNLPETPLSLNSPLLTHHPLGQKFIAPKFIKPLGTINISFVNKSIIQGILIDDIFQQQRLQTSPLIQNKTLIPPSLQPSFTPETKAENTSIKIPELNKDPLSKNSSLQKNSFPDYDTSFQTKTKKSSNTNQSSPHISRRSHKKTEIFRSIITSSNPQDTTKYQLNGSFDTHDQSSSSTIKQKNKTSNTSRNLPLEHKFIQKKYSLNTNRKANDPLQIFRRKSQSKETIQAKIPEQWSSIEELIGETKQSTSSEPVQRTEETTDSSSALASNHPTPSIQRTGEITDSSSTLTSENSTPSVQRTGEITDSSATFTSENSTPSVQRTEETTDSSSSLASNHPTPSIQRTGEITDSSSTLLSENPTQSVQRTEKITDSPGVLASENSSPSIQRTEAITDSPAALTSENSTPSIQRTEEKADSSGTFTSENSTPSVQRTEEKADSSSNWNSGKSAPSVQRTEEFNNSILNSEGSVLSEISVSDNVLQGRLANPGDGLMRNRGILGKSKKKLNVKQSMFLPSGISMSASGEVSSSDFTNKPRNLEQLIQESLKARSELKEKVSGRKASAVKPISKDETELYEYSENVTTETEEEEEKEEDKTDVVELLAREVYGLIRQRLTIEQERYGSFYSGRLPW